MITSSGAICDVCGEYILPIDVDERVNLFRVKEIGSTLCCHNKCKSDVLNCGGDWKKLPPGPLKTAYEKAAKEMEDKQND